MLDRENVIKDAEATLDCVLPDEKDTSGIMVKVGWVRNVLALLKEQEAKQYNSHDVACIIADLFGDPCACNFNDIDAWLPYKCDFRETCCPNPVGVACWEQYLKHKEGRGSGNELLL